MPRGRQRHRSTIHRRPAGGRRVYASQADADAVLHVPGAKADAYLARADADLHFAGPHADLHFAGTDTDIHADVHVHFADADADSDSDSDADDDHHADPDADGYHAGADSDGHHAGADSDGHHAGAGSGQAPGACSGACQLQLRGDRLRISAGSATADRSSRAWADISNMPESRIVTGRAPDFSGGSSGRYSPRTTPAVFERHELACADGRICSYVILVW